MRRRNGKMSARRFARDEGGTQLVELAIVLPVLLTLFAATAEFGRFFYTYTTLAKATRVAARHLSVAPITNRTAVTNPTMDAEAKRLVVYGDTSATTTNGAIVPGLAESNVVITRSGGTASVPERVKVEITGYNYVPLFDLGKFTGGKSWLSMPLKPSTTMRYLLTQPSI